MSRMFVMGFKHGVLRTIQRDGEESSAMVRGHSRLCMRPAEAVANRRGFAFTNQTCMIEPTSVVFSTIRDSRNNNILRLC